MARKTTSNVVDLTDMRVAHSVPQQKRSQKTLERILNATERLLENRIFEDLTVQDIVREAGVSVGSFYARFKNKDLVLQDLYRRYREDLGQMTEQAAIGVTEGMDLSELLDYLVRSGIARMERRRGLIRTIALHMRQHPELSGGRERKTAREARDIAVELIVRRRQEISHDNPRQAARLIVFTLAAVAREFVLFNYTPHASQLKLRREKFIKETSQMMWRYLTNE